MVENKLPFVDDELRAEIKEIMENQKSSEIPIEYDIDPQEVVDKIRHFRSLNIRDMTDDELFNAILDVLLIDQKTQLLAGTRQIPANSTFYRVRKLNPTSHFNKLSDMWEAPAEAVKKMGRLNKPNESLLYVSLADPGCAITECRIKQNDIFALIKYNSINPINIHFIGGNTDYQKNLITDSQSICIHELFNNFLFDEFSNEVGAGTEFLYRLSEIIAKSIYDFPTDIQDAWAYPSVFNKESINVCFRPEKAHQLLKLQGALICKKENNNLVRPAVFVTPFNPNDELKSEPITESIMDSIFPELIKKK